MLKKASKFVREVGSVVKTIGITNHKQCYEGVYPFLPRVLIAPLVFFETVVVDKSSLLLSLLLSLGGGILIPL